MVVAAAVARQQERRILRESFVLSMVGGWMGSLDKEDWRLLTDPNRSAGVTLAIKTMAQATVELAEALIDELEKRK